MDDLDQAIAAVKAGDKTTGGRILAGIVRQDPRNARAWMWLSRAMADPEKQRYCLERVLDINPQHQVARETLAEITGMPDQYARPESQARQPIKLCDWCKAEIPMAATVCQHCGRDVGRPAKWILAGQTLSRIGIWLIILGIAGPICVIIFLALISR